MLKLFPRIARSFRPPHPRLSPAVSHKSAAPRLPALSRHSRQLSNDTVQIKPKLQITFTCKACDHRSSHEMTKQAYTSGTVLIQCPSCKNRHLIADNLKIFSDSRINVEDILKAKGQSIQKGYLQDGDIELLPDEAPKQLT